MTGTSASAGEFVIERSFGAPRDRVWAAWTEAERLKTWFRPKGFSMPACTLDLRPGGAFHYCLRTPNGQEFWGKWVFREIAAPERLEVIQSFADASGTVARHPFEDAWPLELLSTMTFAERDGRTAVTIRWAPIDPTAAERAAFDGGHDSMRAGWTGTLDHLDAYLAGA